MKRQHTAEQYRAAHHERATFAVKFKAAIRRATKPARLFLIAVEECNAEARFSSAVARGEACPHEVMHAVREMKRLRGLREAIEGEAA
jgi:hypothetical protein